MNEKTIEQDIWQWLDRVVIGLNLCPFAKKPRANLQIRLALCEQRKTKALLNEFERELLWLKDTPAEQTDTSLFATPYALYDFYDYLDLLDLAQGKLAELGLEGVFQLASFHPDYVFEGTEPGDRENLTNQAPVPIIHIIREASMAKVLEKYPQPEAIPENNIRRVEALTDNEVQNLFPHKTSKTR